MKANSNYKYIVMGLTGMLVVGLSHWMYSGHMDWFTELIMMFPLAVLILGYGIYILTVYPRETTCFRLIKQGLSKDDALRYFRKSRRIWNVIAIINLGLILLFAISHESTMVFIALSFIAIPFVILAKFNAEEYCNKLTNPAYSEILKSSQNSMAFNSAMENLQKEKERQKRQIERRKAQREAREALIADGVVFGDAARRPTIPRDVVDAVWIRDKGRCVYCGSTDNLQLDHIIPFSKGGATTVENLQLLCQKCNIKKSNHIGNE